MSQIQMPLHQPLRLSGEFIDRRRASLNSYHFRATSGHHFIIKKQTPLARHRRLITEWVSNRLLVQLGFIVPVVLEVFLPLDTIVTPEEAEESVLAIHYPCNADAHSIFDMIPDALGHKVCNPGDFVGIRLVDWWLYNRGVRHALFVHRSAIEPQAVHNAENLPTEKNGYVGIFVGNGDCFGGSDWGFAGEVQKGLYPRPWSRVEVSDAHEYWTGKILGINSQGIEEAFQSIPLSWVSQDDHIALSSLKKQLLDRAKQLDVDAARMLRKPVQSAGRRSGVEEFHQREII
jgi:hypothetical protein